MLKNEDGVDFLILKLVTVLIVASLVLIGAVHCLLVVISTSATADARASAEKVAGIALAEYAEGCPETGDYASAGVAVPGNVRMISFGAVHPDDSGRCRAGVYTINYTDGSSETHIVEAPLGAGIPGPGYGGPLVLYPGRYLVHIIIRPVNGTITALIYPEAA